LQSTKGYPDGGKQSRHGFFAFILQNSPFFTNIRIINSLKIFVKNIIKFSSASVENAGIPFSVRHKTIPLSLQEAVYDSRYRRNLNGPFDTAEDAVASMLED